MDKAACDNHTELSATHVCLSCKKFYCIDCSFSHNYVGSPSTTTTQNSSTNHNAQPLSNIAAKTIEQLQVTLHRRTELEERAKKLEALGEELGRENGNNKNWIKEIKKVLRKRIKEAENLVEQKGGKIKNMIEEGNMGKEAVERAYKENSVICSKLQRDYEQSSFLTIFDNKDLVSKYTEDSDKTFEDLDKTIEAIKSELTEFKEAKDGLQLIELKIDETLKEWIYLLAAKLNSPDKYLANQGKLQAKAHKHIYLDDIKQKIGELEQQQEELRKELCFAKKELACTKNYEKYIEDDTFTLLADSVVTGAAKSQAELIFKKLPPYIRTVKMPTKLGFRGVVECEEGVYCGYWNLASGKREGKGIMAFGDGRVYEGLWKSNVPWGNGRWILPTGNVYEGQVHKGKFHGFGKYIWKDGEQYIGEMKDGFRDGYGMYIGKSYAYIGQWGDDKFNGYGIKSWEDGEVYVGEFRNDLKEGSGMYISHNNDRYIGKWKNNKETGEGLVLRDNEEVEERA